MSFSTPFYKAARNSYAHVTAAFLIITVLTIPTFAVITVGTNTGAIPDGGTPNPNCGSPRDVLFNVVGASLPVSSLSVSFTGTHTHLGDLRVTLIAPDATQHLLFGYVHRTSLAHLGSRNDLNGTYTFSDFAANTFWGEANNGTGRVLPPGIYSTQESGPFTPVTPGPPLTSINAAFASVPDPNGIWTLRFEDCRSSDIGSVSAASLTFFGATSAGAIVSGRVNATNGRGAAGVRMTLTGGNLTEPIAVDTNTFGSFSFENVPAGQTYIITAESKGYTFENPVQVVTLDEDLTDLQFIAHATVRKR
ncbi:MAG: proprotein convertase P-domain-containing protein [Blastocatellia bacterium]|nr:proprotein convertase P-domain-containing protein [Blastocatellia bacterium]